MALNLPNGYVWWSPAIFPAANVSLPCAQFHTFAWLSYGVIFFVVLPVWFHIQNAVSRQIGFSNGTTHSLKRESKSFAPTKNSIIDLMQGRFPFPPIWDLHAWKVPAADSIRNAAFAQCYWSSIRNYVWSTVTRLWLCVRDRTWCSRTLSGHEFTTPRKDGVIWWFGDQRPSGGLHQSKLQV